ncbi:MAG: DUF4349 domain-containing protein [Patescibacteria group bacterium]
MGKILSWIKNNKLSALLLLAVGYLLFKNWFGGFGPVFLGNSKFTGGVGYQSGAARITSGLSKESGLIAESVIIPPMGDYSPQPEEQNRLVVEESYFSLVVDDVRQKADQIIDRAAKSGGYMVSSSINQPEEASFATVVVRVPSAELKSTLDFLRGLAVKVTSETLSGHDVTDQYVDIGERLATLEKTKAKFEQIMDQAVKIDDILRVQRELINLQTQIDSLKGRQDYLKKTAENAKLTIYLSTDEWSLPYAPDEQFRPAVIFKLAIRSLVKTGRVWAGRAIWIGVYSVIWLPIVLVILVVRKKFGRKKTLSSG